MAAQGLSGFYGSVFKRSTTAGILIRSSDNRVLLLRSGPAGWDLPGGVVMGGEDPRSAARRTARGTLGLDLDVGRVLVLDYVQAPVARVGTPGDSIGFVFDGGSLATSVNGFTVAGGEREARFVPVQECADVLPQAAAGRVEAALEALELGTVTELVDGKPERGEAAVPLAQRMMPPVEGFSGVLGR